MPSANKTPNYNLTQYSNNGSDKVSALQDYNEDMSKIDTALNDNANSIITKADKATTYSRTDVDTKLATKADTTTTYSRTDVDTKLATKADTTTTYSKSDIEERLSQSANFGLAVFPIEDNAISTQIQDFINENPQGVYFPAGRYNIYHTINIPFNTQNGYALEMSSGAVFVAKNSMDCMFSIGSTDSGKNNPINELFTIRGGRLEGNGICETGIKSTENICGIRIFDSIINNFNSYGIFITKPLISNSIDGIISRVRVNYVQYTPNSYNCIGIHNEANDLQITDCYICSCSKSIETTGYIYGGNLHLYADYKTNQAISKTVGLDCDASCLLDNIYLDSVTIGIDFHNKKGYTHQLGKIFYMAYFDKPLIHVIEDGASNVLSIDNIRFAISNSTSTTYDRRYICLHNTNSNTESAYSLYLTIGGVSSYQISNDDSRWLDAAFSSSNHKPFGFTVTDGDSTILANQGILIGYIPAISNGVASTTIFDIYSNNGYAVYNRFLIHVTPTTTPNSLNTRNIGIKTINNDTNIAIGKEELIRGRTMYPVYVYIKSALNVNPIVVQAIYSNQGSMNYQYSGGAYQQNKKINLTNDNTLGCTEANGVIA
jgi:hypothetical protein